MQAREHTCYVQDTVQADHDREESDSPSTRMTTRTETDLSTRDQQKVPQSDVGIVSLTNKQLNRLAVARVDQSNSFQNMATQAV